MIQRKTALLIGVVTASLAAGSALYAAAPAPHEWAIGPIIKGRNYSVGMPPTMSPGRDGPWFAFPVVGTPPGHVHYVTLRTGPLSPGATIKVRYRVEAAPGTRFVPQEVPDQPATVSLVLQRGGDNWTAKRGFQHFRWYSPAAEVDRIAPGVHTMTLRLDDPEWTNVLGQPRRSNTRVFGDAMANLDNVGIVFGSQGMRGHGVYASAPARFTLLDFTIS